MVAPFHLGEGSRISSIFRGDFQTPKQPARLFQTAMLVDPHFKPNDGDPGQALPRNLIEQVVPRFFW